MILSMKTWGVAERARFVTDFAKRLLQVNTEPVMMVLEEADAFIPQRPAKGEEAMLGAMDRLVRWGRGSGVGCTIVTQRSAKVNKDVTTQAETLIAFRTTGPQDRDAIDNWIKHHAGDERREEVLSTLPALPTGTAWVWSPEWLEFFGKAAFRRRATFDSAATPKVGQKVRPPKQLAAVDLEQLRTQMAETVEKAKAEDPRELRKQLAAARDALQKLQVHAAHLELGVGVKGKPTKASPGLTDADRALLGRVVKALEDDKLILNDRLEKTCEELRGAVHSCAMAFENRLGTTIGRHLDGVRHTFESKGFQKILDKLSGLSPQPLAPSPRSSRIHEERRPVRAAQPVGIPGGSRVGARPAASSNGEGVTPAKQKILNGLAFLHGIGAAPADKTQLALLVGVSPTSGGYFNNLGALRSEGFIDYPSGGTVALTDAGAAIASTDGRADDHRRTARRDSREGARREVAHPAGAHQDLPADDEQGRARGADRSVPDVGRVFQQSRIAAQPRPRGLSAAGHGGGAARVVSGLRRS